MEEYIWQYRQIRIKDCVLVHEPKHLVRAHMIELMLFAGIIPVELRGSPEPNMDLFTDIDTEGWRK